MPGKAALRWRKESEEASPAFDGNVPEDLSEATCGSLSLGGLGFRV